MRVGDRVLATPWQEGKETAWGFRTVPSDPTLLPDVYLQTLKSEPHLSQPCRLPGALDPMVVFMVHTS